MSEKFYCLFAFAFAAISALSDYTAPVSFEIQTAGNMTLAPVTESILAEPADLPTPVFHFDATRRDGWKFNAAGTVVTNIPSLVGSRYMASSLDGGYASQVYNGSLYGALFLPSVDELGGKPAVSMGDAVNTCRALWFNPVGPEEGPKTNIIRNIGTVVAVHCMLTNAANLFLGGGFFKGSAWGASDTVCFGKNWERDTSAGLGSFYWSPMFYGYRGPMGGTHAFHDGLKTDPTAAGFSGRWEVTIFQPAEAKWEAAGIGMSVIPSYAYNRGGGKWAELYVFDQVVDEDVLRRLDAYLRRKWFPDRRETAGCNGIASVGRIRAYRNVHTPYGATNFVDVASGVSLKIDRLSGGRGYCSALVKGGAGKLKIIDAAHFGGDIVMESGVLDMTRRAVPSLAELPSGLSYRFDASDTATLTLDEEEDGTYVRLWRNTTANTVKSGAAVYARGGGGTAAKRPVFVENALGEGLHAVDFLRYTRANVSHDGRYMTFAYSTDGETFTSFSPQSIYTVVAVMGAQRGGGSIIGGGSNNHHTFARHQSYVDWLNDEEFSASILRTAVTKPGYANVYPVTNSCVMINGVVVDSQKGYETPGFQVVGIRTSAQAATYIGGTAASRHGGLMLCEILMWQRPLSEEEIRDAQAYLTRKWFKRDLEGYHSAGHALPDARTIVANGASEIFVPSGTTVRVEGVTANATLRKTGAGTLEIGPFGRSGAGAVTVAEGKVLPVPALDVASDASAPAAGASMHLDASDASSVCFAPTDAGVATTNVWCWYDKSHRNAAYMTTAARRPVYDEANGEKLNGMPVMDMKPDATARAMYFAKSLDGVRAAFVVWRPFSGASVLGSQSLRDTNGYMIDFCRHSNGNNLIIYNQGANPVRNGTVIIDGTNTVADVTSYAPSSEFQLCELYPAAAAHVSALVVDRGSFNGGARYAEVILYERELSAREKVATRNYLLKKWFNREPEALPEREAPAISGNFAFAGGSRWDLAVDSQGAVTNGFVSATGTLSFGEGVEVSFAGLDGVANLDRIRIAVASAGGYDGLENLNAATVAGYPFTPAQKPVFFVKPSGELRVRFGQPALMLMIR